MRVVVRASLCVGASQKSVSFFFGQCWRRTAKIRFQVAFLSVQDERCAVKHQLKLKFQSSGIVFFQTCFLGRSSNSLSLFDHGTRGGMSKSRVGVLRPSLPHLPPPPPTPSGIFGSTRNSRYVGSGSCSFSRTSHAFRRARFRVCRRVCIHSSDLESAFASWNLGIDKAPATVQARVWIAWCVFTKPQLRVVTRVARRWHDPGGERMLDQHVLGSREDATLVGFPKNQR